jgi:hypothetical protein
MRKRGRTIAVLTPIAVLSLAMLAHAAAAYGASAPASSSDPPAGSPAGAVYELPLEQGRADAAPQGSGGTRAIGAETNGRAGTAESDEESSFYRSENNFGSSSQVPGDPARLPGGASAGAGAAAGDDGSGTEGTPARVDQGEVDQGQLAEGVLHPSDTGNTSAPATVALLCLIGLIAVGSGGLARRVNRLRTQR